MKVLIISHNPISTYQSMGKTFLSLFSSFKKEELCQLYIYPTVPDIDICESYYRVTDRDVLKSYVHFGRVKSRIFTSVDIDTNQHAMYENESDAEFFRKNQKNSFSLIGRDLMWLFAHWYNGSLKTWLAEQKPTCIFLAPGESKFIYNIAMKIANKLNIPIFSYVCDEYYFIQTPKKITDRLQLRLLQKKIRKVMKKSVGLIAICDMLADAYHKEFGVESHTIHTGSNYPIASEPRALREEIRGLTYMGNLAFKRYESLADIGRALDEINDELGSDYKLFVYTRVIDDEAERAFFGIRSIRYCGYVSGEEFKKTLHGADVLVHVESFDPECTERVKHSVSTKIADSLGSGIPLLGYGPENIASMSYLLFNGLWQASDAEGLKNRIRDSLNAEERIRVSHIGLQLATLNHDQTINSRKLYAVLQKNEEGEKWINKKNKKEKR